MAYLCRLHFPVAALMVLAMVSAHAQSELRIAWPTNVGALNPHLYSPNQLIAQAMVYEPLVKYRGDGKVVPWLAERWTISPDGMVYEFHLRPGVTFSDGHPFNAEAVKRNVDAVLMNRSRHLWLELLARIERVEVVTPMTVRFVLKSAYYPFLQDVSLVRPLRFVSPASIPESGDTAQGIRAPIGTGPWVLAETRKAEHDLFRRNPSYWGKQPGYDAIRFKVLPEADTRALALETGDIDLVYGTDSPVSADAFMRLKASGRFTTAISPPLATRMIALNSGVGPTAELAVRRAIHRGINRALIVAAVLSDMEPQADTMFAPILPYTNLGLAPAAFDPARAAQLLDEAGWRLEGARRIKNATPLELDLVFVGSEAKDKAVAEVVQADLAKLGIKVNLIGEEASAIQERQRNGRFNLAFSDTWGPPYDPHAYASSMRAPAHADFQTQRGLPMKADIDARISKVLLETSDEQRAEDWRWILTTLHEQAVYLPLSSKSAIFVHTPRVGNVQFGATAFEFPFETLTPGQR